MTVSIIVIQWLIGNYNHLVKLYALALRHRYVLSIVYNIYIYTYIYIHTHIYIYIYTHIYNK
jgi:hypothetical protein